MGLTFRKILLTLRWFWLPHHKQYYEKKPRIGDVDVAMQKMAMTFTMGRLTWGKTALHECKCKVCHRKFWTLTKGSQVCRRYGCYMKFHLYPEQFAMRKARQ